MLYPNTVRSLMCHRVAQTTGTIRRVREIVVARVDDHLAMVWEKVVAEHIRITINGVSTYPHGVVADELRSIVVCLIDVSDPGKLAPTVEHAFKVREPRFVGVVGVVGCHSINFTQKFNDIARGGGLPCYSTERRDRRSIGHNAPRQRGWIALFQSRSVCRGRGPSADNRRRR